MFKSLCIGPAPVQRELEKESCWSDQPWKPGQIPTRTGSLRPVYGATEQPPTAYGEFMAVQKTVAKGMGLPKKGI